MNSVLQMNEQQANKVVAKVMRITFLIFAVVFGMNVAGIFVVDQTIMTVPLWQAPYFYGCRRYSDESGTKRRTALNI